ncbi:MAG TPA: PD-(D/E)XK nuclease family protein [Miltoncostaeaceae bacterium]|nr:PD-(D/E)XK nuclease family protein [Miltoncostaeaceae bacterium]
MRAISHSELLTLTECPARWAFRYGGMLTGGDCLDTRTPSSILRAGRAWGVAVFAFHAEGEDAALEALERALNEDADELQARGSYVEGDHHAVFMELSGVLAHYAATVPPLAGLHSPEEPLEVPIPSRGGRRSSNRYRYTGRMDAVWHDEDGRAWIVEFKLRGQLTPLEQLALDRQGRRYAWAWERGTGERVAGVIYDEALNLAPKAPRVLASGRTSHDKRQITTAAAYERSCEDTRTPVDPETSAALARRQWHQRYRLVLRPEEIKQTGLELVWLARQVQLLESGVVGPVRAPSMRRCPGCAFRSVCPTPEDRDLVDALFERVPPKRLRGEAHAA